MKPHSFVPIILVAIACGTACDQRSPEVPEHHAQTPNAKAPNAKDPSIPALNAAEFEAALFDRLAAHVWDNNVSGAFGHNERLSLRRDGTYHWKRRSDVTERDQSGAWNFVVSGKTTGVVRLSATGDLPFAFVDEKLCVVGIRFVRGEPMAYTEKEKKITASDLKPVPARETTLRLAATAWVKTNSFEDYRLPDRLEFSADGRYTAQYRGGACRHGGLWGLEFERNGRADPGRVDFFTWADEHSCDLRPSGAKGVSVYPLTFSGDLLLIAESYAPVDKKPTNNIFIFDRYYNSMRTRGEYAGKLTAGQPTKIEFAHESASGDDYDLKSLEIEFPKQTIGEHGPQVQGELKWVLRKDLSGRKAKRDAPYRHTVEVTPPFAGPGWFYIRPIYADWSQSYDGYQSYGVTIAE